MTKSDHPFAVPTKLPLMSRRVRDYWESLKRGDNDMPFWDDVNLSSMPELADRLILVDAFEIPQRFRLNTMGEQIKAQYGLNVTGKFMDEIQRKAPFEFFTAQASATVEAKAPTFYHQKSDAKDKQDQYHRFLLPLWGNGRIEMILGLVTQVGRTAPRK
jgi:hypothetical protein